MFQLIIIKNSTTEDQATCMLQTWTNLACIVCLRQSYYMSDATENMPQQIEMAKYDIFGKTFCLWIKAQLGT